MSTVSLGKGVFQGEEGGESKLVMKSEWCWVYLRIRSTWAGESHRKSTSVTQRKECGVDEYPKSKEVHAIDSVQVRSESHHGECEFTGDDEGVGRDEDED